MASQSFSIATALDDGDVRSNDEATYPPTTVFLVETTHQFITINRSFSPGPLYTVYVGLCRWDTSSIPDNATVTGAQANLISRGTTITDPRSIVAEWYEPGTIAADDYVGTASTTAHTGTLMSTFGSPPYPFTLVLDNAAANVNKSGYTGLRFHVSGGEPTGQNFMSMASFDHATDAPPQLVVFYDEFQGSADIAWTVA